MLQEVLGLGLIMDILFRDLALGDTLFSGGGALRNTFIGLGLGLGDTFIRWGVAFRDTLFSGGLALRNTFIWVLGLDCWKIHWKKIS